MTPLSRNDKGSEKMEMEIKGIVKQNPIMLEDCCIFTVEQEDGTYLVVSTDRQAVKDHIFVQRGQRINIRGSGIADKNFKGVMVVEWAKISTEKNYINNFRKSETF